MKIVVCGNGPSTAIHAAEIDAADLVVRCNVYATGRCDVWASFFDDYVMELAGKAGLDVKAPHAFWLAMSPAADRAIRPGCNLYAHAQTVAAGRPVMQISDAEWIELSAEIGEKRPSTGLVAIRMALNLCPQTLVLAGFDATAPEAPGWGNALYQWAPELPYHNFAAEKAAIQRLVDTGRFCGCQWGTKVTWLKMEAAQ